MNSKNEQLKTTTIGEEFISDDIFLLFGNNSLSYSNYKEVIRNQLNQKISFHYVNQVHGDGIQIITNSEQQPDEADAMITSLSAAALVIKTADCIPIAIHSPIGSKIALVHAGWRGVLNQITNKAVSLFNEPLSPDLRIYIGPHISSKNFQVTSEVLNLFKSKFPFFKEFTHYIKDMESSEHYYINLESILIDSLKLDASFTGSIIRSDIDTLENQKFHSYRRLGAGAGRNLSILMLR